ncbi:MAG: hypothetical protein QW667_07880 [Candidatus Bathyarchaeia archaeon]
MGFSVTISSSIILIVLFALSSSFLITIFQGLKEISYATEKYLSCQSGKLGVALHLTIDFINATSCIVTVKNTGSKVIFLKKQEGFSWNTIILSYGNDSFWFSYPIENYEILEIKVSETNYTFSPEDHSFLNSGEEAKIYFNIPENAPEIPLNGLVSVVFVSHYGVDAKGEGVRTE